MLVNNDRAEPTQVQSWVGYIADRDTAEADYWFELGQGWLLRFALG